MRRFKEFRIDSARAPFDSQHLIIRDNGFVEVIKNTTVKNTVVKKKESFFKELDSAIILDFKMMMHYVQNPNNYHISIIYSDDTEESHFYIDTLQSNNQLNIRSVLMKYLEPSFLIDVVTK